MRKLTKLEQLQVQIKGMGEAVSKALEGFVQQFIKYDELFGNVNKVMESLNNQVYQVHLDNAELKGKIEALEQRVDALLLSIEKDPKASVQRGTNTDLADEVEAYLRNVSDINKDKNNV